MCELLGFDPDELFDLEPREGATAATANPPPPFPTPCRAPLAIGTPGTVPGPNLYTSTAVNPDGKYFLWKTES